MALAPARRYQPVTPISSDARNSRTLPGTYYYDPAIFEQEKKKIFYKNWQFFAHTTQLREPGDYVAKTIIDQDIIVVRGQDMKLRAFYNVCSHRGATLMDNGTGNRKTFVCPYHN